MVQSAVKTALFAAKVMKIAQKKGPAHGGSVAELYKDMRLK
jgi:hypothetical protein